MRAKDSRKRFRAAPGDNDCRASCLTEHCGYFATNVKRSIKRRRAINKRKKAEEERRQKQIERRRQQRAAQERRRDSNGLVQVHSRDDRRPPSGSRPRGDQ